MPYFESITVRNLRQLLEQLHDDDRLTMGQMVSIFSAGERDNARAHIRPGERAIYNGSILLYKIPHEEPV